MSYNAGRIGSAVYSIMEANVGTASDTIGCITMPDEKNRRLLPNSSTIQVPN